MTKRTNLSRRAFLGGGAVALASLLGGCSGNDEQVSDAAAPAADDTAADDTATSDDAPAASTAAGKVLVAYYSAQGHTKAVAETIASAAGADLFELVPAEPYTSDDLNYNSDESRVTREHDDESLRDVELAQATPDGWDGYDTVFVGYPIWWGIAAWPTNAFASGNDFSGKTVIPFCTSASSGLGESGANLEALAGTGEWQEGQRFSSSVDAAEVEEWVAGLGL